MSNLPSLRQVQIWGAVLALVLAATGCDSGSSTPPPPTTAAGPSAAVIAVSGSAFACAQTTGCTTPARLGAQVFSNGEARTAAGATANLQTASTVFRLEERATIQFKAVTDAVTQITLAGGRLFANHTGNKDQITIQAGDVRVDTLDTKLTVVMSDTGIYVGVPDGGGSAKVTLPNGQTGTLPESFTYTILTGAQQLPDQVLMDPVEQGRWDHFSSDLQPTPFVPPTATPGTSVRIAPETAGQMHFLRTITETSVFGGVAIAPDGETLASGRGGVGTQIVQLWRIADGTLMRTLISPHAGGASSVAFAPDGKTLAAAEGNSVLLWRIADGALLQDMIGLSTGITKIAFSPDGQIVAAASGDAMVRLWRVNDGTLLRTLTGHTFTVQGLAFSPDGRIIASGSEDKTTRLWQVADGTLLQTLPTASMSMAFTSDSQTIAVGSFEGSIFLWRVSDGTLLRSLKGHTQEIRSIDFSLDGQVLVSGAGDQLIMLWRVSDGTLLQTLKGHTKGIKSVVFSSNGQVLVSAGDDDTIRLWGISDPWNGNH